MTTKVCLRCKKEKPLDEFGLDASRQDGYNPYCKACRCIWGKSFYWKHQEKQLALRKEYSITARGRYYKLRSRGKQPVLFDIDEFVKWYNQQDLSCYYCKQKVVVGGRGFDQLNIERKDNNLPYTLSNIVLSCRRCNMVKSAWFTELEMLEIAERYFK